MKCPKCHSENPPGWRFCRECGTPLSPSEDLSTAPTKTLQTPLEELTRGTTFARRYDVIEEVGRGGMGKVYRAIDKNVEEEVALKILNPEVAADEKMIDRFRNELKLARKITHRNVCQMYDLNDEKGTQFIIMEYVPGEDLRSLIKRIGRFTIGKSILIAKQVCEGLSEAHRLGVVHRDLKPQNIMIDKEGNVRIMDFGIARVMKTRGVTEEDLILGTPEYMSPEQVEGKDIDSRSDIYSLGVILYEMVTGKPPFQGDTPFSIALKHKSEKPPDPRQINNQVSDQLSRVILKCLEKDKGKRYQSADDLSSELSKIERDIPTTDKFVPRWKLTTRKWGRIARKKALLYGSIILLAALLIAGGIYIFTGGRDVSINSIAVLPLKNLSGAPEQEYIADGMTEALISNLTQIRALERVISSRSVRQYKDAQKTLPEIAGELNVDAVVDGSILISGERVRITVQLIEARTDRNLWSKSYEQDVSDILALQSDVSRSIANEIKVALTPEEKALIARSRPSNPEAYKLYLQGRHFWNTRTKESLYKAIVSFQKAIELDPDYAMAYVGLADAFNMLGSYDLLLPRDAYQKAKAAALKALEKDEQLAEAYTSLAWVKYRLDLDWFGAEADFNWAIGLNPGYATAHQWYGALLRDMSRFDEALTELNQALELDPFSLPIKTSIGFLFYQARQYDKAIEHCQKVLEIDPEFPWAYEVLGLSYIQKSSFEEAITEIQRAVNFSGRSIQYLADLAFAYSSGGEENKSREILEQLLELSTEKYVPHYHIGVIYSALGEKDKAFQSLEKAVEERSSSVVTINTDPSLDNLRSDPRFLLLLEKMGLD
jgi:serine/threonine protein kinase/Tfp pilus assembly protein PilF